MASIVLRRRRKPTDDGLDASCTTSRTLYIPTGQKKIRGLVTPTLATLPFARVCITEAVMWGPMLHLLPLNKGVSTKSIHFPHHEFRSSFALSFTQQSLFGSMDPTFRQVCEYYNHDFYPTFYDTAAVLGGLQHIARIKSPLGQRIPISAPCVLTTAGRWSVALMAATTMYVGVAGATNMMEMPHKRRDSESGRSALEIARERRKMSNVFDAAGMTATLIWSFKRVMAGNVGLGVRIFRVIGAYSIGGAVGTGAYMAWAGLFGERSGLQGL